MKTLSAICRSGPEGFRTVLEALPNLPSDTGAEGMAGNKDEILAHLEEFCKTLQGPRYKTKLGKRLRLLIGKHLSTTTPEVAIRIILDVCKAMKPAKTGLPSSENLQMINSTLLADGISVLAELPLPVAGYISDLPTETVSQKSEEIQKALVGLGTSLRDANLSLTSLTTSVIPFLRICESGLMDIKTGQVMDLIE